MLLKMQDICMNFGSVRAIKNVSFSIDEGEIHGLLGENGAGKSTLMNILGGGFPPSSGAIFVDDLPVRIQTPVQAAFYKIRFIHQELNLCNDLRVFENIFLGEEMKHRGIFLDKKAMIDRTQKVLDRMNSNIRPTALVGQLESAEKQLVEIAKALVFKSRLIIMDEPTTALGQQEIDQLFKIMRALKEEGVSFIYISHKMPEIFDICDRYTVLRDGKFIATGTIADVTERQITDLMVGKELVEADLKEGTDYIIKDRVVLSLKELTGAGFSDISLEVCPGEIVAITGLHGSGVGALADTLFGAKPYESGTFSVNDYSLPRRGGIRACMKSGIALVPRNRKERGILGDLSICDNLSMAEWNMKPRPTISLKEQKKQFAMRKEDLNIKANNPGDPITSLSGGNQQKVIIGRWLETNAEVYLLDNPTQGIDVGAKLEIYRLILNLAKNGKVVLIFTSDFPEIYKVADRCLVLYRGQINAMLSRDEMTEERIIFYSTGANIEEEHHA